MLKKNLRVRNSLNFVDLWQRYGVAAIRVTSYVAYLLLIKKQPGFSHSYWYDRDTAALDPSKGDSLLYLIAPLLPACVVGIPMHNRDIERCIHQTGAGNKL